MPDTAQSPPDPIQPGQFVVAGDGSNLPQGPPAPSGQVPSPPQSPQSPSTITPQPTQSAQPGPGQSDVASTQTQPTPRLAVEGSSPQALRQEEKLVTIPPTGQRDFAPKPPAIEQPSPTPFVTQPTPASAVAGPSSIQKLRILVIGIGALLLLGIVATVFWVLVLGKRPPKEPAKTQVELSAVEEPPFLPKRATSGFADLPPIAEASGEATSSASNQ